MTAGGSAVGRCSELFYVSRVVLQYLFAQASGIQVDIDLGCGDALVAEHLLNGAQVGAPFEQMGGEAVAQCMR